MSSFIQFVCPVTLKRERTPLTEEGDGVFVPVEDEEDSSLPPGWGRLIVERVIPHPELAQIRAVRQSGLAQMTAAIEAQIKDPANPHAAQLREEYESGLAAREMEEALDARHPLPERETILVRATFSALSDEAIDMAMEALRGAGFSFPDSEGL